MQAVSKRNVSEAAQRTIATQLARDLLGRIRANNHADALREYVQRTSPWPAAWAGRQRLSGEAAPPDCSPACDPAALALRDLVDWERNMDGASERLAGAWVGGLQLPTACVEGPTGASGLYTVTVAWRGSIPLPAVEQQRCGSAAAVDGVPLYGDNDEFLRSVQLTAFVTARP